MPSPRLDGQPPSPATHVARATYDLQIKQRQDAFLAVYPEIGNISEAADMVGISRETVRLWIRDDDLGFKQRFTDVHLEYGDYLRGVARKRLENPTGHVGGDILLIAGIAAHGNPEWRIQQGQQQAGARVQVTQIIINAPGQQSRVIDVAPAPELPETTP